MAAGDESVAAELVDRHRPAAEAVHAVDQQQRTLLGPTPIVGIGDDVGDRADRQSDAAGGVDPGHQHEPGSRRERSPDRREDPVGRRLLGGTGRVQLHLADDRTGPLGCVPRGFVGDEVLMGGHEDLVAGLEAHAADQHAQTHRRRVRERDEVGARAAARQPGGGGQRDRRAEQAAPGQRRREPPRGVVVVTASCRLGAHTLRVMSLLHPFLSSCRWRPAPAGHVLRRAAREERGPRGCGPTACHAANDRRHARRRA